VKNTFTFCLLFLLSLRAYSYDSTERIIKKWTFNCEKDLYTYPGEHTTQELTAYLKEYTRRSLAEGLHKINLVNSKLRDGIFEELSKKIKVSCEDLEGGVLGSANPFWKTLKVDIAGLSNFISRIQEQDQGGRIANGDSIVFHEILHHAKIDNFSSSDHNSFGTDKTADIVYSCSTISFKHELDSCVVCALATKKGRVIVLENSVEKIDIAKNRCLGFTDDPYGIFEKGITITPEKLDPENYKNQMRSSKKKWGFMMPSNLSVSIDWPRIFGNSSSGSSISKEECAIRYKDIYDQTKKILRQEADQKLREVHLSIESIGIKQVDIECVESLGETEVLNIKSSLIH
jgi:hypothetical protein